jgi:ribosomal protein L37AE/L43A
MQVNCEHECPDCTEHVDAVVEELSIVRLQDAGRELQFDWRCQACGSRFSGGLSVSIDDLQRGRSDHIISVGSTDVHVVVSDYRRAISGAGRIDQTARPEPR